MTGYDQTNSGLVSRFSQEAMSCVEISWLVLTRTKYCPSSPTAFKSIGSWNNPFLPRIWMSSKLSVCITQCMEGLSIGVLGIRECTITLTVHTLNVDNTTITGAYKATHCFVNWQTFCITETPNDLRFSLCFPTAAVSSLAPDELISFNTSSGTPTSWRNPRLISIVLVSTLPAGEAIWGRTSEAIASAQRHHE